jgi:hypothetical protein
MIVTRVFVFVRTINYSLLLPFLSSSANGMGTMIIPFYDGYVKGLFSFRIFLQDFKISF